MLNETTGYPKLERNQADTESNINRRLIIKDQLKCIEKLKVKKITSINQN